MREIARLRDAGAKKSPPRGLEIFRAGRRENYLPREEPLPGAGLIGAGFPGLVLPGAGLPVLGLDGAPGLAGPPLARPEGEGFGVF